MWCRREKTFFPRKKKLPKEHEAIVDFPFKAAKLSIFKIYRRTIHNPMKIGDSFGNIIGNVTLALYP